jgi:hypothetical protein
MVYAGWLKKHGAVASAKDRKSDAGKAGGNGRPKSSTGKSLPSATPKEPKKPTVVEALQEVSPASAKAQDGNKTSAKAIRDRFNSAKAVAGVHTDKTLETASGDELIEMGETALRNMDKHKEKMPLTLTEVTWKS